MMHPVHIHPESELQRGLPPMQASHDSASTSPVTKNNLRLTEMAFIAAMQKLGFGRFEDLHVRAGELILDPWPTTIRDIKFASPKNSGKPELGADELRPQVAEFFQYVRDVDAGEIHCLEIKHGLPFGMEVELAGARMAAVEGYRRA
jgi:hypothetical protein